MYINLASADKKARVAQINSDIGTSGNLLLYTGNPPSSPDHPATGTLLVTLPLSATAATASYAVQSIAIVSAGSGGTTGNQLITGSTGSGNRFQASVTIANGAISAINGMVDAGAYSVPPTTLTNEPINGANVLGATVSVVLTGQLIFNPITQAAAVADGIAGYGRIQTAAGAGIVDLDCGTINSSILMTTTTLNVGVPVTCSAEVITEA